MKRSMFVFLSVAALIGLLTFTPTLKRHISMLPVVYAQGGCSNATLTGNYVFTYSGWNSKRNNYANELPIAAVGVGTFDGAGNATFSYNFAFNGHVGATSTPDVGTYAVNSDCTLTISDPAAGQSWAGGIIGGGAEFSTIVTTTGYTAEMSGKKQ